ncbi:MAG: cellulase family glycosylhydrolase [Prevotella sp.]|nr:cellulase family glycosylhydrolase [Prevotella sp.]
MKRYVLIFLAFITLCAWAQTKELPSLHVEGRWLVDKHGNQVVLHGVMDTPSNYFNGGRWEGSKALGWWDHYNDTGAKNCLAYFEKIFQGMEQSKCTVFRLHMDPAWTNDNNITATGFSKITKDGKEITIDPTGQEVSGEADISHFSKTRYAKWLPTVYLELAKKALNHGMYVVVRPPGVCPGSLKVGDYYNQYLLYVWDIFSQQEFVKNHAGQISIELANEPVSLKNANNQDDSKALHDFFQPIVDKIRSNGFTGVIWAPGTTWQQNYRSYAEHPIEGENIGYAVHDYCGWYGCSDDNPDPANKIRNFHESVPVVDFAPVIITEVDWSPENPNAEGHYNESGAWVKPNYGTWATGSTSKWGKAFKANLDYFGNISMTLSSTSCLFDIDALLNTGYPMPAFNGLEEACGKACMDWYAEYYTVNVPHPDSEEETGDAYTIQSISAATGDMELEEGGNLMVSLKAVYADGHTKEINDQATYTFDNPTIASSNYGYIKGLTPGSTKVTATYTDKKGQQHQTTFNVTVSAREFFSFNQNDVSSIWDNCTYNESTRAFTMAAYGQIGWKYPEGIDISGYKYLVVKLKQEQNIGAEIRIFPVNTIWGANEHIKALSGTMTVTKLSEVNFDLSKVYIIDFWSRGGTIYVDDVYLTNNDDYSKQTTGISIIQSDIKNNEVYNLQGVKVGTLDEIKSLPRGLYIIGGKKVVKSF